MGMKRAAGVVCAAMLAVAVTALPGAAAASSPPYGGGVCASNLAPDSLNQLAPGVGTATATGTVTPADGRMSLHAVAQDQAPAGVWLPYVLIPQHTVPQPTVGATIPGQHLGPVWTPTVTIGPYTVPVGPASVGPYYVWGVGATTAFQLCRMSHAVSGLSAGTRTVSVSLDQIAGALAGGAASRATGSSLHPLVSEGFARVDARLRIEYYPCGTCAATAVTETPLSNVAHSAVSSGAPPAVATLNGSIAVASSSGTVVVHVDVQAEGWVRGSWRAESKISLRVAQISIA